MTDTIHNGTEYDTTPAPVTPKARKRAARALIEALMDELTERHDGNPTALYVTVRQALNVFDSVLVAPTDARELIDQHDRDLIWQCVCAVRDITGAAVELDDDVRPILTRAAQDFRPKAPEGFAKPERTGDADGAVTAPAKTAKGGVKK